MFIHPNLTFNNTFLHNLRDLRAFVHSHSRLPTNHEKKRMKKNESEFISIHVRNLISLFVMKPTESTMRSCSFKVEFSHSSQLSCFGVYNVL